MLSNSKREIPRIEPILRGRMDTIIKFENVSKKYSIRHRTTKKPLHVNRWLKFVPFIGNGKFRKEDFWALLGIKGCVF
jgi:hypothetical protein